MSYYLEVSASEVPPSAVTGIEVKQRQEKALLKEDEIRLYLFLKRLYSAFPSLDDIVTSAESDKSIWGNDVQFNNGTLTLTLVYSKLKIGIATITSSAREYGLSVFDLQTGEFCGKRIAKMSDSEMSMYSEAHKYLSEMTEWTKFSGELDAHATNSGEEERLKKLAETGYGPAKRALSFDHYLCYMRSTDKSVRRHNLKLAYDLIKEVATTAYASRSLLKIYKLAAEHEGLNLND